MGWTTLLKHCKVFEVSYQKRGEMGDHHYSCGERGEREIRRASGIRQTS